MVFPFFFNWEWQWQLSSHPNKNSSLMTVSVIYFFFNPTSREWPEGKTPVRIVVCLEVYLKCHHIYRIPFDFIRKKILHSWQKNFFQIVLYFYIQPERNSLVEDVKWTTRTWHAIGNLGLRPALEWNQSRNFKRQSYNSIKIIPLKKI